MITEPSYKVIEYTIPKRNTNFICITREHLTNKAIKHIIPKITSYSSCKPTLWNNDVNTSVVKCEEARGSKYSLKVFL
uniref:Uncharacterized protein n=1 Tax=Nelumbo nucifera TaxID=4432 RepID=A0A822Y3A5_NELNU|nr:TPA_asm: hypothetical protein HUJ06_027184 [Nelumbo nucifera]